MFSDVELELFVGLFSKSWLLALLNNLIVKAKSFKEFVVTQLGVFVLRGQIRLTFLTLLVNPSFLNSDANSNWRSHLHVDSFVLRLRLGFIVFQRILDSSTVNLNGISPLDKFFKEREIVEPNQIEQFLLDLLISLGGSHDIEQIDERVGSVES